MFDTTPYPKHTFEYDVLDVLAFGHSLVTFLLPRNIGVRTRRVSFLITEVCPYSYLFHRRADKSDFLDGTNTKTSDG